MHDIKAIREQPDAYDRAWASRGLPAQTPGLLVLDGQLRAAQTALQQAQSRRNEVSKLIGVAKGRKDDVQATELMAEVEALKARIGEQAEIERAVGEDLRGQLAALGQSARRGRPARRRRTRQCRSPPLGRAVRHCAAQGPCRAGRGCRRDGLRGRRPHVRVQVRHSARPFGAAGARLGAVHARHADQRARLCRNFTAAAGARRGDVRHRPVAEVRGGPVPHHRRPLVDSHRRGFR